MDLKKSPNRILGGGCYKVTIVWPREMMHALTMTVGLPTEDSALAARWYSVRGRPT